VIQSQSRYTVQKTRDFNSYTNEIEQNIKPQNIKYKKVLE